MGERKYFIDTIKRILLLGHISVVSSFQKMVNNIQYRELKRSKLLPEVINSAWANNQQILTGNEQLPSHSSYYCSQVTNALPYPESPTCTRAAFQPKELYCDHRAPVEKQTSLLSCCNHHPLLSQQHRLKISIHTICTFSNGKLQKSRLGVFFQSKLLLAINI